MVWIASLCFIDLKLFIDLFFGDSFGLSKLNLFTLLQILLFLNVVDEKGSIFSRRKEESRILRCHKFCHRSFVRKESTDAFILKLVQDRLDLS